MKIDAISDLYQFKPKLPGGDVLIVAGNLVSHDTYQNYQGFNAWLSDQDYECKIIVAGNRDKLIETGVPVLVTIGKTQMLKPVYGKNVIYLEDSGHEYNGVKFWGSPWSSAYQNWYFLKDTFQDVYDQFCLIPNDIDVLITHAPPFKVLDQKLNSSDNYGCSCLLMRLKELRPKYHVFGQIHASYGQKTLTWEDGSKTKCFNVSHVNQEYKPINKHRRITI